MTTNSKDKGDSMSLQRFDFSGNQVRVVDIDGEFWFVSKDVCDVLEVTNNRDALSRLKQYEKGVASVDTLGGEQDMTIISESGLYRLVLTSRKPQAEPFQDWVCQEVLPSLRKTGSYSVNDTRQDLEEQFADTPSLKDIKFVSEWYGELHGKAYQESYVHQKIRRFYPALAGDPVPPQHRASLPESRLLTPTEIASELGFKYKSGNPNPRQVNALLEKLGYQVKTADKWDLTEKGKQYGVFKPIDTKSRSDKDQLMWQSTIIDVLKEFSLR